MAVAIILNQVQVPPIPAGVAGQSREDIIIGTAVNVTYSGGPFAAQLLTIIDKPVDFNVPGQSTAFIAAGGTATPTVQNVDFVGSYLLQVVVDSGFGLGALPSDIARIVFYARLNATTPLNPKSYRLPRRKPAFLERLESNVPDSVFALGNPRGWAQERDRWDDVSKFAFEGSTLAWGRVALTGAGAVLTEGEHVASVVRTAVGTVTVTLPALYNALNGNYRASATARGGTGGMCTCNTEVAGSFQVERADAFGALADADFTFAVQAVIG